MPEPDFLSVILDTLKAMPPDDVDAWFEAERRIRSEWGGAAHYIRQSNPQERVAEVLAAAARGDGCRKIAKATGIPKSTVQYILSRSKP